MRIRLGVSPDIDLDSMGAAIDAALEATTAAQVPLIARGAVPDIRTAIEQGRVRWRPEPPGDEHFDDARTVLVRGWGDCDDLAPWHAAGLRASGEDPNARAFVYQSGPRRWHAVVERSNGVVDDPSQWAGMRKREVVGAGAPIWPPMWDGKLGLAAYPFQGGWAGRVDVPDIAWPLSWSALSTGMSPAQAIVGAIRGAYNVATQAGVPRELDVMRLCGLDSIICGQSMDVVGEVLGDDYIGFLPALLPAAGALVGPAMGMLGNLIPGMGGKPPPPPPPGAPAPSGGGFGGGGMVPGATLTMPGGPIIVRF